MITGDETSRPARARELDTLHARRHLVDGLLRGAPLPELRRHAAVAGWPLPDSFLVIALSPAGPGPVPSLRDPPAHLLVRADTTSTVVVADPAHRPDLLTDLRRHSGVRIAASWPVVHDEVPDAWRWVRRAHELVDRGVIAPAPVILCSEHRTQLWLHSEPSLRARLRQELLEPLLAETPNSRQILGETMLAWLESGGSAMSIAARLGVHPQTVRYRQKRIHELFGTHLQDAEFVVQVTMILKASLPLWKAGDRTDVDRFRTDRRG